MGLFIRSIWTRWIRWVDYAWTTIPAVCMDDTTDSGLYSPMCGGTPPPPPEPRDCVDISIDSCMPPLKNCPLADCSRASQGEPGLSSCAESGECRGHAHGCTWQEYGHTLCALCDHEAGRNVFDAPSGEEIACDPRNRNTTPGWPRRDWRYSTGFALLMRCSHELETIHYRIYELPNDCPQNECRITSRHTLPCLEKAIAHCSDQACRDDLAFAACRQRKKLTRMNCPGWTNNPGP